jgi:hypothetical protein
MEKYFSRNKISNNNNNNSTDKNNINKTAREQEKQNISDETFHILFFNEQ